MQNCKKKFFSAFYIIEKATLQAKKKPNRSNPCNPPNHFSQNFRTPEKSQEIFR
jgi:hypothetical protein